MTTTQRSSTESEAKQAEVMAKAGPQTVSTRTSFFDATKMEGFPVWADPADPDGPIMTIKALINHSDPDGFSLWEICYRPNAHIPRHRHDVAQVVMVLEGELYQGNRKIGPGGGYFTPANSPYAVTAGPEGVRLVEFRHSRLDFSTEWV